LTDAAEAPAEAPSAPADAPEAEGAPLDLEAALAALAGEQEGEPEAEAPPPEDAPAKPAEADLFSEAALATPAGVKAARAKLQELRQAAHKKHTEMKVFERKLGQKEEKLQRSVDKHVTEKQSHALLLNNVRANLQGLHSGDPEQMILALGGLTGQDGIQALEQLNSRLLHKGKVPLDPQVQALLDEQAQRIEQLTAHVRGREEQAHQAGLERQIDSHAQRIVQMVTSDESLPHLSGFMRDDPAGTVRYLIGHIESTGGKVAASDLFRQVEAAIVARLTPKGGNGAGPVTKKPAPNPALRLPGQSIGPSTAGAATHREPSEDEAIQALATDPFFLQLLAR
jgi:hypothetical protein